MPGARHVLDAQVLDVPIQPERQLLPESDIVLAPDQERWDLQEVEWLAAAVSHAAHGRAVVVEGRRGDTGFQEPGPVDLDLVRPRRVLEDAGDRASPTPRQRPLGHAGQLEEEHIPAAEELGWLADRTRKGRGVGGVQDEDA